MDGTTLATFAGMLNRRDILTLLQTSIQTEQATFARQLARTWLKAYPGDLVVQYWLAQAYRLQEQPRLAATQAEMVTLADPEMRVAWVLLASTTPNANLRAHAQAHADVLADAPITSPDSPAWAGLCWQARQALAKGQAAIARDFALQAMQAEVNTALPLVFLLQAHLLLGEMQATYPLVQGLQNRWDKCVALHLALAEGAMHIGDHALGVEMLQRAAMLDSAGTVVVRYWGREHAYKQVWGNAPTIDLPAPIPAVVSSALGLNQLPGAIGEMRLAESTAPIPTSEPSDKTYARQAKQPTQAPPTLSVKRPSTSTPTKETPSVASIASTVQAATHRVLSQLPDMRNAQEPAPLPIIGNAQQVHVILSSLQNLTTKFGETGAQRVLTAMDELARSTEKHTGRTCLVILPDSAENLKPFGLKPVSASKAWDVKLLLADLHHHLQARKRTLGSLLIVGNDDVIPFHRLPNPTDDVDEEVPSDNPYGTPDDNYFVTEWSVGRMPCPCDNDPTLLVGLLQQAAVLHRKQRKNQVQALNGWLRLFFRWFGMGKVEFRSAGFTAQVWRPASLEVLSTIGDPRDLYVSPPTAPRNLPRSLTTGNDLLYFNLHGLEDKPEWYGQRDQANTSAPMYPQALTPADLLAEKTGKDGIIFSEACYGANILQKKAVSEAMSLQFLANGATAVVGSTKIAYGSVAPPLVSADLLAHLFWEHIRADFVVGEALQLAKAQLARDVHARQGYLDGEDQKTLLSFVLYGDPLLPALHSNAHARKLGKTLQPADSRKVIASSEVQATSAELGDPQLLRQVKSVVAEYLPGMDAAEVHVSSASVIGNHQRAKSVAENRLVYTFRQSFSYNSSKSYHFARVTVNKSGEIVKLAVSR
ncbi:MAG TPA: hypothetical protein PK299_08940 [Anaerolineales bacterium]|nr:hypothetical protein [Anaerolineales bacterium]